MPVPDSTPPKPFCFNPVKVKAFVLGCDPTNFSDNGCRAPLHHVFGIGQDPRYFKDILANLNLLGLHLEELYIQNLIPEYLEEETSHNKNWMKIAEQNITSRKLEFDAIDPSHTLPVLLTSEILLKVLINADQTPHSAKELYANENLVPVKAHANRFERPLIPLYRYLDYSLSKKEEYKNRILNLLK